MSRSASELMGLEYEAERLVRSGETRAEVSRILGVHPQTLACWALRGGWRKKDLDLERSAHATRETLNVIRDGARNHDAVKRLRAERIAVLEQAVKLLADGSAQALARVDRLLEGMTPAPQIAPPVVELGIDPKIAGMGSLAGAADRRDAEEAAGVRLVRYHENGDIWIEEERGPPPGLPAS